MGVLALFVRGFLEGALGAAAGFAVLAISFAAVFFVLICAAPLRLLQTR
jgi:hypothetical protein